MFNFEMDTAIGEDDVHYLGCAMVRDRPWKITRLIVHKATADPDRRDGSHCYDNGKGQSNQSAAPR